MDKSLATNLCALLLVVTGLALDGQAAALTLNTGLFALSGGLTNWLAIHMLFEKVPGFHGSGVIPARFEEFKAAIRVLVMEQFFSPERIEAFFDRLERQAEEGDFVSGVEAIVARVDLDKAFESLVEVIMQSSFAGLLGMVGGREALEPLKEPFVRKMREFLLKLGEDHEVLEQLKRASSTVLLGKVEEIVDQRLDELTPQLVKEIVQRMIREHLGWLVVWGGVLGGLIGLLATLLTGWSAGASA